MPTKPSPTPTPYAPLVVEVEQDDSPDCPLAWGNIGMAVFTRRYVWPRFGAKVVEKPETWADAQAWAAEYGHRGLCAVRLSDEGLCLVSAPEAEWDRVSALVWAATSEGGDDDALHLVESEVGLLNQWADGDVWAYVVRLDDMVVESCGGFYGDSAECRAEGEAEAMAWLDARRDTPEWATYLAAKAEAERAEGARKAALAAL